MRIWNLHEPESGDLAEKVVATLPTSHLVRPRMPLPAQKPQSLKIIVGIASLALAIQVGSAVVNTNFVRLPSWEVAVTKSGPNLQGPLDTMFHDRFSSGWTEAEEASLLDEIVANRLLANEPKPEPNEVARFVFSNQQEDLTVETPRLSLGQIQRIVKERKTS